MVDSDCSLQQLNNKQNKHNLFFIFKNSKKKTRTKYDKKKSEKGKKFLKKVVRKKIKVLAIHYNSLFALKTNCA